MAYPTSTRKALRRAICQAARMGFYRSYPGEIALTGTSPAPSATALPSTLLTQGDDNYWKNGYVLIVDGTRAGEERKITAFTASSDILSLEYALSGAPAAGDKIEITEVWSPADIHAAINRAIREVGKLYPENVVDTSLIFQQDKMSYLLTGLVTKCWKLHQVWGERPTNSTSFSPTVASLAAGTVSLTLPTGIISADDQYNGWKISVYNGTGTGQLGTIVDTVLSTKIITIAATDFVVTPATTSLLKLWDANVERYTWSRIMELRTDFPEYPNNVLFNFVPSEFYGFRMKLVYTQVAAELSTDAGTTIVPTEYIINAALGFLHESRLNDTRADMQRHSTSAQYFRQIAQNYIQMNQPKKPADTAWQANLEGGFGSDIEDPLGWRS